MLKIKDAQVHPGFIVLIAINKSGHYDRRLMKKPEINPYIFIKVDGGDEAVLAESRSCFVKYHAKHIPIGPVLGVKRNRLSDPRHSVVALFCWWLNQNYLLCHQ